MKKKANAALEAGNPLLALRTWEQVAAQAMEEGGDALAEFHCFKANVTSTIDAEGSLDLFDKAFQAAETVRQAWRPLGL